MQLTILPSEARSVSGVSEAFSPTGEGAQFTLDITDLQGDAPLLTMALDKLADGAYVPVSSVSSNIKGQTRITLAPDVRAFPITANEAVHGPLPETFRVRYYIEGGAFTFSVDAEIK